MALRCSKTGFSITRYLHMRPLSNTPRPQLTYFSGYFLILGCMLDITKVLARVCALHCSQKTLELALALQNSMYSPEVMTCVKSSWPPPQPFCNTRTAS